MALAEVIFFSLSFTRDHTLKESCRKVSKGCWRVEPNNSVVANDLEALNLCVKRAFRSLRMP